MSKKTSPKRKAPTLSKKGARLLESLCDTAKSHGYQEDSGTGSAVVRARENYETDRADLIRYVAGLERRLKKERPSKLPDISFRQLRESLDFMLEQAEENLGAHTGGPNESDYRRQLAQAKESVASLKQMLRY